MQSALDRLRQLKAAPQTADTAAASPDAEPAPLAASVALAADHAGVHDDPATIQGKIAARCRGRARVVPPDELSPATRARLAQMDAGEPPDPLNSLHSMILNYLVDHAPASLNALVSAATPSAGGSRARAALAIRELQAASLIGYDVRGPFGYRLGHYFLPEDN